MPLNEPFPLELFSARIRTAILDEFDGRCPSLRDVAEIPDARWLSAPAIGPAVLNKICGLGQGDTPPSRQMTDAELLRRLTVLQEEFRLIQRAVRKTLPQSSREALSLHPGSLSSPTLGLLPSEALPPSGTLNRSEASLSP